MTTEPQIKSPNSSSSMLLLQTGSTDSSSSSSTGSDIEDTFLRACRHGDLAVIKDMLEKRDANIYNFDISCKGKSKSNLGWTPLHLATYFGHKEVAEQLLAKGAEINARNENGETPLHKASFIGREDLVMLLIQYNADVSVINGEGRLPRDMTPSNEVGDEIARLLRAAETTEILRKEGKLLSFAREGNIEALNELLKSTHPPNINCVDAQGNSSLHCASYRGHKEVAVLLLQNGIDTMIRNQRGQLALDLARDAQTMQVLSVKSARRVQKTANRFEGPLLKRSRFLGWKPVWAVLERGVLNYYASRADSTAETTTTSTKKSRDTKRKDYKYLDSAKISPIPTDMSSFVIHFNDGAVHRFCVVNNGELSQVERQKWINAFNEHAAYSSHYLWGVDKRCSSDDEIATRMKPLGCMSDALGSASASFEVLQRQLGECAVMVEALQKSMDSSDCSSGLPVSALMVGTFQLNYLRFQLVSETAANMMASLQHCLTLFHQQEDIRVVQLKQEQEKCRVLEEALNVLAKEHHELEQSVVNHISETGSIPRSFCKSSRIFDTDDEFFDAFNEDSDTDTLVQTESIFNTPSGSVLNLQMDHHHGEEEEGRRSSISSSIRDGENGEANHQNGGRRGRRRKRRTSGTRGLLSSSTDTLTNEQYFTDVSKLESSSSTSSSSSSASTGTSSSSSSESTRNTSHRSQSTTASTSYYTQRCDSHNDDEDQDDQEHQRLVVRDESRRRHKRDTNSDKSESNSSSNSSDTLVGMSNATSCATLISEGGNAYRCARGDIFYDKNGVDRDLISLKTPVHRKQLPVPMFSRNDFNIWSVLKNCIGKELSKITMPVIFNEPLSFLERMAEFMEYSKLLRIGAHQSDPVDRLKYVTAFVISSLSSNWDRLGKPFNPLLGETYEIERDDFRMISEQVSHHPPISAFHSDSPDFVMRGWLYPKLKFWGKSIEIQPKGNMTIEMPRTGDVYTWSGVNCAIHNVIVGKLWMEHFGQLEITNHKTGHKAVITIKPAGWNSKDIHRVEGFIVDKDKKKLLFIYGKYTEFLKCTSVDSYNSYFKENSHKFKRSHHNHHHDDRSKSPSDHTPRKMLSKLNSLKMSSFRSLSIQEPDDSAAGPPDDMPEGGDMPKSDSTYSIEIPDSITLWEVTRRPNESAEYYHFTLFAMGLNEFEEGMETPRTLCPTDSRLRPDIRKLENGDLDGAAAEKNRLEEAQRERDKRIKKKSNDFTPRWFQQTQSAYTKADDWLYKGGYWDRDYRDIDGIF